MLKSICPPPPTCLGSVDESVCSDRWLSEERFHVVSGCCSAHGSAYEGFCSSIARIVFLLRGSSRDVATQRSPNHTFPGPQIASWLWSLGCGFPVPAPRKISVLSLGIVGGSNSSLRRYADVIKSIDFAWFSTAGYEQKGRVGGSR